MTYAEFREEQLERERRFWRAHLRLARGRVLSVVIQARIYRQLVYKRCEQLGLEPKQFRSTRAPSLVKRLDTYAQARAKWRDLERRFLQQSIDELGNSPQRIAAEKGCNRTNLYRVFDRLGVKREKRHYSGGNAAWRELSEGERQIESRYGIEL